MGNLSAFSSFITAVKCEGQNQLCPIASFFLLFLKNAFLVQLGLSGELVLLL